MSSVPRDPGHYSPTEHAVLRKRRRNIEWESVSEAIQEGEIYDGKDRSDILFEYKLAYRDKPLRVYADPDAGDIITVAWKDTGE